MGLANLSNPLGGSGGTSSSSGSGVTSIIPGSGISVDQATGAVTVTNTGVGGVPDSIRATITQVAHGLAAKNAVYSSNGTWTKAKADAIGTAVVGGFVESVVDVDNFVLVYAGATTVSGLTVTTQYYLSDATAGLITTTAPTTVTSFLVPVLRTGTSTKGYVEIGSPASLATLTVAGGGTGAITLTSHGVLVGQGTSAVAATAAGTSGQPLLSGGAGADPAYGTLSASFGGTGLTSLGTGVATFLGTPSSANLAAAVTGETGSGALVFGTDPALTVVTPATTSIGYLGVPQNSQSTAYTTVLTDAGKEVFHPVGDNNARTFTIDSNANVAYVIGTVLIFTNMAAANVTIAITSDTLTLLGAGTTGSRTLTQYGTAAARKITSTSWIISGVNLT